MKRRSFLELLGFTAVGGSIAAFAPNDAPDWDNDEGHSANARVDLHNQKIVEMALRDRSQAFADLVSNNNALLDYIKVNHDPSPFWKTSSNG